MNYLRTNEWAPSTVFNLVPPWGVVYIVIMLMARVLDHYV